MTYREAVARVTGLRGGEMAGMRPGLERIEALLEAVGNPERAMTLVQVAGTNGKGSVAAMLAAILESAGRRVGLYTSPHLLDLRERIRVDDRPIGETEFADGVEALGTLIARLDATMFEALTALALDHFASDGVEVAVLETGLGGRLDSTSVGRPAVEVITRIDYDHQAYLGDTLEAIAGEKAAIIRSGVALSARQEPAVEAVLARQAALVGVPLLVEGRDLRVRVRGASLDGQWLDLEGPGWRLDDVRCGLLGVFQPGNALLAAAAARALGAGDAAIRVGPRPGALARAIPADPPRPARDRGWGAQPGWRAGARGFARGLLPRPARDLRHRHFGRQGPGRHPGRASAAGRADHLHRRPSPAGCLPGEARRGGPRPSPVAGASGWSGGISGRGPTDGPRAGSDPYGLCRRLSLSHRRDTRPSH